MEQRELWDRSLYDELKFWDDYLASRGMQWHDEYLTRINHRSLLGERLITNRLDALVPCAISILDVGAGPLTTLGKTYPGKVLSITPVDPLADQYDILLDKHNIQTPVRTVRCHGEGLLRMFRPKQFDFAYARNSLDHSYDPLAIIRNMLKLVRRERFVVLRHFENEAVRAQYHGLHQWNFEIASNELVLWNPTQRHNLTRLLAAEARVEFDHEADGERQQVVCTLTRI